ncbi:MAG: glycosyltransferase family 2 protein [Acidobacteria bacterium]|nr:glycosyltransferase family 2 protein [Acidobacteriota bacterium]
MPAATVIIPTFDHGPTLLYSVGSALAQTVEDLEIFIIGDGVPAVTREVVDGLMSRDGRVRFFDHPKGPRHGEVYRHEALAEARGEIVCYLSDDDLWTPEHVETMRGLLRDADFAHTLPICADEGGGLHGPWLDLSLTRERELVLAGEKNASLSSMGHTLEMYRRLPFGWRTTPHGVPTDAYMQRQFLAHPDCRAASGMQPTTIHFASPERAHWSLEERLAELERWQQRLAEAQGRADFNLEVLDWVLRAHIRTMHAVERSPAWRMRESLLRLPLVGRLLRAAARAGDASTR